MRICAESRNHAPERNIVHCIGDAVKEINKRKKPDKTPSGQPCVEYSIYHKGSRENSDYQPGFILPPAGSGTFDNVPHDWIIERIKDTGTNHDRGYGTELGG